MVKRITVYTAFGQFIKMIERQAEQEKEQIKELDTDRFPIDHPLSDYQNALNSVQDIHVQSCPVDFSVSSGTLVKKSASCPFASFTFSHPVDPILTLSPVPTTIETKKLNEATEMMMSFWKIHVTTRKPTIEESDLASLFEKIEGMFAAPSTTSVASLFGKFEELFEENKEMKKEDHPSLFWMSPDNPSIPQLPVFAKSPVDSLKIYKGTTGQRTDEMADDELTLTVSPCSSSTSSTSTSCSTSSSNLGSSTVSNTPNMSRSSRLLAEVRLQSAVIEEQKKIIGSFYKLQCLNQKMSELWD